MTEDDQKMQYIKVVTPSKLTPQILRETRLAFGLTKSEAASIVGLRSSLTWHNYETGRLRPPIDRWSVFSEALKTGSYRQHLKPFRRGPFLNPEFVPGEKTIPKQSLPGVPCKGFGFASARAALRLSARDAAEAFPTHLSPARLRNIESCVALPSAKEVDGLIKMVNTRLIDLRVNVEIKTVEDIAAAKHVLRLTSAELGQVIFPAAKRPGVMIDHYTSKRCGPPSKSVFRALNAYVVKERRLQIENLKAAIQDLRG